MDAHPAPAVDDDEIIGYEITDNGWTAMTAARERAFIQEGIDSIESGDVIPDEQVMADLRQRRESRAKR